MAQGMNDMVIIAALVSAFLVLGVVLPFIKAEFPTTPDTTADPAYLHSQVEASQASMNPISGWQVAFSLLTIWFWSFGAVPLFIDLCILLPMRIVLVLTIARNIWPGGGA